MSDPNYLSINNLVPLHSLLHLEKENRKEEKKMILSSIRFEGVSFTSMEESFEFP